MRSFKASVSKDLKRFNIVVKANSLEEAKSKLHKEGYNILTLQESADIELKGNKFYFDIFIDGEQKKWTIAWDDILKIYIKLVEDLKYNVISLSDKPDETEERKATIMNNLLDQYKIYKESKSKDDDVKNEALENYKKKGRETFSPSDSFYMKKKLEDINKIITFVLIKLENLLNSELWENLDFEKKEKIQKIQAVLMKIRGSTNIEKLKEIWEKALLKLWEIELQLLEQRKDETHRKLLKDTNGLLKKIGSKRQFKEKERDIWYILKTSFWKIRYFIKTQIESFRSKKWDVDKTGHEYIKNLALLNKYEEKKSAHIKEVYKNVWVFLFPFGKNADKRDALLIRMNVLKQNIKLFDAKFKSVKFSYTKVKKGYSYFADLVVKLVGFFKEPLFIATSLYSFAFLVLVWMNYFGVQTISLWQDWLFYLILGQILLILLHFVRGFFSLIFIFAIFTFVVIFTIINF